jgi:hypothetical protein
MKHDFDQRNGRPIAGGREVVESLTDDELEAEVTIAVAEPRRRAIRLDALLLERARRRQELAGPA